MLCQDLSLANYLSLQGFLMQLVCAVIAMIYVPLSTLVLLASSGACIMYIFDPIGIGGSPAGGFHPCGVMKVDFLFLCPSYLLFSSLYYPVTLFIPSYIFHLLSWVSVFYFAYPSVFLINLLIIFPCDLMGPF